MVNKIIKYIIITLLFPIGYLIGIIKLLLLTVIWVVKYSTGDPQPVLTLTKWGWDFEDFNEDKIDYIYYIVPDKNYLSVLTKTILYRDNPRLRFKFTSEYVQNRSITASLTCSAKNYLRNDFKNEFLWERDWRHTT